MESMTHSKDEEETCHVSGLLDSVIVIIRVDGGFNDSWYKWKLATSFAEN